MLQKGLRDAFANKMCHAIAARRKRLSHCLRRKTYWTLRDSWVLIKSRNKVQPYCQGLCELHGTEGRNWPMAMGWQNVTFIFKRLKNKCSHLTTTIVLNWIISFPSTTLNKTKKFKSFILLFFSADNATFMCKQYACARLQTHSWLIFGIYFKCNLVCGACVLLATLLVI